MPKCERDPQQNCPPNCFKSQLDELVRSKLVRCISPTIVPDESTLDERTSAQTVIHREIEGIVGIILKSTPFPYCEIFSGNSNKEDEEE